MNLSGGYLPGGLMMGGKLHRSFGFKAVTGALELTLGEAVSAQGTHPARVTAVLLEALDFLGDNGPPDPSKVWGLSVGDRQFLMRRLGVHMDDRPVWLSPSCGSCGEMFDVPVRHSLLPVKEAGEGYPEKIVETSMGRLKIRVPTGADQEAIASTPHEEEALRCLLHRIARREGNDGVMDSARLSEEEIAHMEMVVEAMSPEVASHVITHCPSCEGVNRVPVSPYVCMEKPGGQLFEEIHLLAFWYHWSEQSILELPRSRRKIYLQMIDRSRGLYSGSQFLKLG